MARLVYIGDEATAVGFRLAGLDVRVCDATDASAVLQRTLAEQPAGILLDGALQSALPATQFDAMLAYGQPVLALVPDIRGRTALPDLVRDVRDALGIES